MRIAAMLWLVLLVAACTPAPVAEQTAVPPATSNSAESAATAQLTPAATATPTATPQPTNTPMPTAMATVMPHPLPLIAISADFPQPLPEGPWQLYITDDPATALASGAVDAAVLPDGDGHVIGRLALAVSVPFTSEWEATSLAKAVDIQTNGHDFAVLIPWRDMDPTQKALRIDGLHPSDPDYPLQQTWSLHFDANSQVDFDALTAHWAAVWPQESIIHLASVGDVMLDRFLGERIGRGDLAYPFAEVYEELVSADFTLGNLESSLGDTGEAEPKSYTFQAPPDAAAALALAGFDLVSLANNHALDYGPDALAQGIDLLTASNVAAIGAGHDDMSARAPHIVTINDMKLAFLGYVHVPNEYHGYNMAQWEAEPDKPGVAWGHPEVVSADVAAILPNVDHVIVVLHSGYEYKIPPSPAQRDAAHAAIDAGATLVIGHHTHILQGVEFYGDGVIVYGLGNFAFEIDGDPATAILNAWLDRDGVRQIEFIPALIQVGGQPRLAAAWEAPAILAQIYGRTRQLNPMLR